MWVVGCWFQQVTYVEERIDIRTLYSEVVVVDTLQCSNMTQLGGWISHNMV
jgi:hypothetical protein